MSDKSNPIKLGRVQVKFADGTEHTLPIHGITMLQILALLDALGVKNFNELQTAQPSLTAMRFMLKIAAQALTFERIQEVWSVERLTQSLPDMADVVRIFTECMKLSSFQPQPSTASAQKDQNATVKRTSEPHTYG